MEEARGVASGALTGRDLAGLIRGVRYVFLAVAALSAALGWLLGHPLPFIVALIIAGVDILETTFLLIVVTLRRDGRLAVPANARRPMPTGTRQRSPAQTPTTRAFSLPNSARRVPCAHPVGVRG